MEGPIFHFHDYGRKGVRLRGRRLFSMSQKIPRTLLLGPQRKWDGDAYRVRASWLG